MILLEVENATVSGGEQLVDPVSFSLRAGQPFTLLGETGSGKSLLVQAVTGTLPEALKPGGTLRIAGKAHDLAARPASELWGHTLAILPQEPWLALDPTMIAEQQVAEGYRFIRGMRRAEAMQAARDDLRSLGVQHAARRLPQALSGGMAQRVAFAAARAGGANILVADEPTKGLDVERRDEVIALLMQEVQAGGGLLTVTHDIELARQIGGEVAVMLHGKIIERGPAEQVLNNPRHPYTRELIAADPQRWPPRRHQTPGERPVLETYNVGKSRGGRQLFGNVSLRIHAGEVIGLTGPSGCGKSSFGDILLGLLAADEGEVRRHDGLSAVKYQKIFQDPPSAFAPKVTLRQTLDDVVRLHRIDRARIAPLMAKLKLPLTLLDRLPGEVSGGELQRFALVRVLLLDPVFLFADEPTSRLDLLTQRQTIVLMVEVAAAQNCALMVVSHDEALINNISHRSFRFDQGGIVHCSAPQGSGAETQEAVSG